jgi:hypothetical protein
VFPVRRKRTPSAPPRPAPVHTPYQRAVGHGSSRRGPLPGDRGTRQEARTSGAREAGRHAGRGVRGHRSGGTPGVGAGARRRGVGRPEPARGRQAGNRSGGGADLALGLVTQITRCRPLTGHRQPDVDGAARDSRVRCTVQIAMGRKHGLLCTVPHARAPQSGGPLIAGAPAKHGPPLTAVTPSRGTPAGPRARKRSPPMPRPQGPGPRDPGPKGPKARARKAQGPHGSCGVLQ